MSGDGIELTYVGRPEPEPYIMAPRDMLEWDPDRPLSIAARFLRLYLYDLATRPGWRIYVSHVKRSIRITSGVWARLRRELEAAGYYRAERGQDPSTGKWVWRHFVYRDPITPLPSVKKCVPAKVAPPAGESIPPKSMDGPSINGCEGDIRRNTQHMPTKRSSRKYARAPAVHAAANEQPPTRSPKKTWRERPSGIVCWYSEDHDLAQQIEATVPPNEVSAAVAAIRATGKDPVPGLVKKEIQRAQVLREKAAQAKHREESGPLAEALRRRAERERREADPVAREAGLQAARKAAEKLKKL